MAGGLFMSAASTILIVAIVALGPASAGAGGGQPEAADSVLGPYVKRRLDPAVPMVSSVGYPAAVLDVAEEDLVGLACSERYVFQDPRRFTYMWPLGGVAADGARPDPQEVDLEDQSLANLLAHAVAALGGSPVNSALYCAVEGRGLLLIYEVWDGGGGTSTASYLGLFDRRGGFTPVASVPADGEPYPTCDGPLQLTKAGRLFLACGAGDGPYGALMLYAIDFRDGARKLLIRCRSVGASGQGLAAPSAAPVGTVTCM